MDNGYYFRVSIPARKPTQEVSEPGFHPPIIRTVKLIQQGFGQIDESEPFEVLSISDHEQALDQAWEAIAIMMARNPGTHRSPVYLGMSDRDMAAYVDEQLIKAYRHAFVKPQPDDNDPSGWVENQNGFDPIRFREQVWAQIGEMAQRNVQFEGAYVSGYSLDGIEGERILVRFPKLSRSLCQKWPTWHDSNGQAKFGTG